jgi:hypothetical protein
MHTLPPLTQHSILQHGGHHLDKRLLHLHQYLCRTGGGEKVKKKSDWVTRPLLTPDQTPPTLTPPCFVSITTVAKSSLTDTLFLPLPQTLPVTLTTINWSSTTPKTILAHPSIILVNPLPHAHNILNTLFLSTLYHITPWSFTTSHAHVTCT